MYAELRTIGRKIISAPTRLVLQKRRCPSHINAPPKSDALPVTYSAESIK